MAFDGITIASVVKELKENLVGGRIYKIAQPEPDALLLTIKTAEGQKRLFLSAGAALPLLYLTEDNQPSPMTAPNFCMLLRKHLQNGRIMDITQPALERIVHIHVEHLDELGDLCRKQLIIELMGKHSNIIFCDEQDRIIDSIKRVSGLVSSVREVLPGKPYFVADTTHKKDPLSTTRQELVQLFKAAPMPLFKAFYTSYTGISPCIAQELCSRAHLEGDQPATSFSEEALGVLYQEWEKMAEAIRAGAFAPCIAYEGKRAVEFAAFPLTSYAQRTEYSSMSALLEQYYAQKNAQTRILQKSVDLRHLVQTALERNVKKLDLQLQQLKDTEKRDTYRVYGELLHTYGYEAEEGAKALTVQNYYTGEEMTIPLDPALTASENAKRYFDKYGKLKRTYEALQKLTKEGEEEIAHLRSIEEALRIAVGEEDLAQIREELVLCGYIRRRNSGKKGKITSRPFHYVSSDGYDIYVGKNNLQNEELTFRIASGGDWWFHAKGCPGSHVIVKGKGQEELPDRTFEEAARLAAYYSAGRQQAKVDVDYVKKKQVKKPNGAKPGFVVYYTNFSMSIAPDITGITCLQS